LGTVLLFESFDFLVDKTTSNILDHLYEPIEFTIITLIYSKTIHYKWFKLAKFPIIFSFWLLAIILSIFIEGLVERNMLSFIIGSFGTIVYAFIYKYQLFTTPPTKESLFRLSFFWINTAHLFFYLGTFFQMGMDTYLHAKAPETAYDLFLINYIMNYTVYGLYIIGMLCKKIFK